MTLATDPASLAERCQRAKALLADDAQKEQWAATLSWLQAEAAAGHAVAHRALGDCAREGLGQDADEA